MDTNRLAGPKRINRVIVDQHAEDAAFLWILRDAAVSAPHYDLRDLARLDGRIEAHLDGLRIAGDAGWAICRAALSGGDAGEVFVAAVLGLQQDESEWMDDALQAGIASYDLSRGLASALSWLDFEVAEHYLATLLMESGGPARRVAVAAYANQRRDPGPALLQAANDPDPELRTRAYLAIGEIGAMAHSPTLRRGLEDGQPEVMIAAAWSAALLTCDPQALRILHESLDREGPFSRRALETIVACSPSGSAYDWLIELSKRPATTALALVGIGLMGDPIGIPVLLEMMDDQEVTKSAGEGFSLLTGVDLALNDLDCSPPEGAMEDQVETSPDKSIELDPDEDLPMPDPKLVRRWWDTNRSRFQPGERYFLGQPFSVEGLREALRTGRQRHRRAAALALAAYERRGALYETRAPGFRQALELGLSI